MSVSCGLETLRIPRGLWADLEQTVIQQDRQFLTEVARTLGLNVKEVLRKCLGTSGTSTSIACLLGEDTESVCPYYFRSADSNLWTPCGRLRIASAKPCAIHVYVLSTSLIAHADSPTIKAIPTATPVKFKETIYWVLFNEKGVSTTVWNEDGMLNTKISFRWYSSKLIAFSG